MDVKKAENGSSAMVPRQFMDLGPVSMIEEAQDEPSGSTADAGSPERSSSPMNKEIVPFDQVRSNANGGFARVESPEQTKLVNSKGAEHAQEATMRKARVSVRARSEAPMVSTIDHTSNSDRSNLSIMGKIVVLNCADLFNFLR